MTGNDVLRVSLWFDTPDGKVIQLQAARQSDLGVYLYFVVSPELGVWAPGPTITDGRGKFGKKFFTVNHTGAAEFSVNSLSRELGAGLTGEPLPEDTLSLTITPAPTPENPAHAVASGSVGGHEVTDVQTAAIFWEARR